MSTFDRFDIGTSAHDWRLDDVPALPVPYPGDRVVVLAAHPDDETLGAGGLIAGLARRGVDITVVIATDGEASHPDSTTHSPDELADVRRSEVAAALGVLAPGLRAVFLGLPDSGLADVEPQLTDRFADVLTGRLAAATHVVSPWTGDRHPDHEACGRVAAAAAARIGARHWQYPIWAWHWADPTAGELPTADLRRLHLTAPDAERKSGALQCHRSQHEPLSPLPGDEAVLSPQLLEHFAGPREFFLVSAADATSAASFETLYSASPDPWDLGSVFYERRKRDLEFASLPRPRFVRAFEPGCALGLLTERLADRCDEVVAWDVSPSALDQARRRVADRDHITLELRTIPDEWPDGRFDLIVVSEVGYYVIDLDRLVERILGSLADDGVVLACHWRRPAPDHPHTAEAVHHALAGAGLHQLAAHVEDDFLLHVWGRSPDSVARRDGIVG